MHPTLAILLYVISALAMPGLPFWGVQVLAGAAALSVMMVRRPAWRLLWRTRWLMLVLMLGYAYSLPGDAVWASLGNASPTSQGLLAGAERALRLALLLLWLDLLVLRQPADRLLAGLHGLILPLQRLGLNADRIALRLALTLRAIETLEHRTRLTLREQLTRLFNPDMEAALPERVAFVQVPFRATDRLILSGVLLLMAGVWFSA